MNQNEIKKLLKSINKTDIDEIKYQVGDEYIYIKKFSTNTIINENKVTFNNVAILENKKKCETKNLKTIKSMLVGIFYSIQNKQSIIKEGCDIKIGQKIGQIETMKIIKDVYSNVNGKILKILVTNGQIVEYGQGLFLIKTKKNKSIK
ncbi:MAG: hypothetical protein LBL53_00525 [Endomicrobium sp.]|jgi:biotin carboxyl carrier protein|nr:hypothetical protein [Endomicrobium sp.]